MTLAGCRTYTPCRAAWLGRGQDNAAYEGQEERPRASAAGHAGVARDAIRRRVGTAHPTRRLPPPFRLVQVSTGKMRQDGTPDVVVLGTPRRDRDAALIASRIAIGGPWRCFFAGSKVCWAADMG